MLSYLIRFSIMYWSLIRLPYQIAGFKRFGASDCGQVAAVGVSKDGSMGSSTNYFFSVPGARKLPWVTCHPTKTGVFFFFLTQNIQYIRLEIYMGIELIILMLNDDMDVGDFISPCSCNHLDNFGHIPLRFGHLYWLSRSEVRLCLSFLVGGLEHVFPQILGIIIPTDELIFFRGVHHQPKNMIIHH